MNKKTWTILICAYNCTKTIVDTLNSIVYEDNDDIDVFIVDDGSTDNLLNVVQPFIDKHPNIIHYFRKENGNQGSCINYAIDKANSRYLSLLDSDDIFNKADFNKVLHLLRHSRYDTDLVLLNFDMIFLNKKFRHIVKSKVSNTCKDIVYKPFEKMSLRRIITIHSSIYSVDLLKKITKVPEKIGYSDNVLYLETMLRVKNVAYLNKHISLYQYEIRGKGQAIYATSTINRFNDILSIYDRMLSVNMNEFGPERAKVIKKIVGNHIYWIMAILGNNYKLPKREKPAIIKNVYAKLHAFEQTYNCKVAPTLVKMFENRKYGGIFFIRFMYEWVPIAFLRATRYTKEDKIEAKKLRKLSNKEK